MRILIVSDAWRPQINGVVRTLQSTVAELERLGHAVEIVGPDRFRSLPCPSYPEIRLALPPPGAVGAVIDDLRPDAVHIATEGPLGFAARAHCRARRRVFTTAYHTRFPEYVHARCRLPLDISYGVLRWFHAPSASLMVATPGIEAALRGRGFRNIARWSRGVDTELFRPRAKDALDLPRPIALYVGRVAVEKNIEAFLRLDLPGSKVVVGDGPQRAELCRRHPEVHFLGAKSGEDLARHYAAADVFVFPSRTDTFGLVLLEALASGVPVAAYPVAGPIDVIGAAPVGCLDEDLGMATRAALAIKSGACRDFALGFSWAACTEQFLANLHPFRAA